MLMTTWNVCAITQTNSRTIQSLVRSSDLVCFTETLSQLQNTDLCQTHNAIEPAVNVVSGGGVAIIHKKQSTFRPIACYAECRFQMNQCVDNRVPILAVYFNPRIPNVKFQRLL